MPFLKIKYFNKLYYGLKKNLLDLIFPCFCVGCGKEGSWLCPNCLEEIIFVVSPTCPQCGRLSENGSYCSKCQKNKSLEGIIVSAYYEEGPLKEAIHNFKYNSVKELSPFLANFLIKALETYQIEDIDLITWVPLYHKRQAQRGYNQAEILAREIAQRLDLKTGSLLKKIKKTKIQVKLKGPERRKNLIGAFKVNNISLKSKRIILVDDITTTGTTLNECAKVLKKAGAKEVWGLVLAKG